MSGRNDLVGPAVAVVAVAAVVAALLLVARNEESGRTTAMPERSTTSVVDNNVALTGLARDKRAVGLTVDSTGGGLVVPGDRVDILATNHVDGTVTKVLQEVEVLAIGRGETTPGKIDLTVLVQLSDARLLVDLQARTDGVRLSARLSRVDGFADSRN